MTMSWSSVAQWTFMLLYALNFKGTLFVWHIRFCWLILKHGASFWLSSSKKRKSPRKRDFWQARRYTGRASMGDLDYNIHKSNST